MSIELINQEVEGLVFVEVIKNGIYAGNIYIDKGIAKYNGSVIEDLETILAKMKELREVAK